MQRFGTYATLFHILVYNESCNEHHPKEEETPQTAINHIHNTHQETIMHCHTSGHTRHHAHLMTGSAHRKMSLHTRAQLTTLNNMSHSDNVSFLHTVISRGKPTNKAVSIMVHSAHHDPSVRPAAASLHHSGKPLMSQIRLITAIIFKFKDVIMGMQLGNGNT